MPKSADAGRRKPVATGGDGFDAAEVHLPAAQRALVAAVTAAGTPTVAVIVAGRPHGVGSVAGMCDALVYAWYPARPAASRSPISYSATGSRSAGCRSRSRGPAQCCRSPTTSGSSGRCATSTRKRPPSSRSGPASGTPRGRWELLSMRRRTAVIRRRTAGWRMRVSLRGCPTPAGAEDRPSSSCTPAYGGRACFPARLCSPASSGSPWARRQRGDPGRDRGGRDPRARPRAGRHGNGRPVALPGPRR